MSSIAEARQLIPDLCRQFYTNGWVSGTGGGMSIRVGDKHVVAPSGVQKERMEASDLFVLDAQGNVLENPVTRPAPYKAPKLSECYPLFQQAFTLRDAGAVMHSHSVNAVLATLLDGGSEFRVTNLEMIKGIQGHGYYDSLCIPIIENTARECELTASLREAILKYPNTQAVLVRRHGVYVWGKDWIQAKTQAECYDYLFEAAVRMRGLGIDASLPPAEARPAKKRKLEQSQRQAVVLDIEGTVLPISFVKETLFPYAAQHMQAFLAGNVDRPEVHASLRKLHSAAENDGEGKWGLPHSGSVTSYKPALQPILSYISRLMQNDRKLGPLKELQGMVWHSGMASGDLVPELFSDVVPAMQQWADSGAKVYIFSSGSRQAQTDMFAHTSYGDIRHLLSGFFDTSSGAKMEAAAYSEIALAIGMDAHQIHFFTDIAKEADAAQAAGWHASLVSRPGNAELAQPVQHPLLTSLAGVQLPTDVPHKAAKLQNGHSNGTLQNGHK